MEKRIKELRRRKRAQRNRSRKTARTFTAALIAATLLLFIFTGVYALASSGEAQRYLELELPASNLEELRGLEMTANDVAVPAIPASAAILLDQDTHDVLYEKNADQSLPMASTTKIMTAIVALENSSLQDSVTISDRASAVGESSAWLEKGEVLSVEQLLYALMVQSGNDAAVALAEHVAGTEELFVEMMNAKARELGLSHTSFRNSHGLDQEGHFSSARDLAEMASYAMGIPKFAEIAATRSYEIPWPGHPSPRVIENHNKLLKMYPYATGIKTGYTAGAGKCLVASAREGERELISVVLNGGEGYWDQTISLMEYGFNQFALVEYAYAGQPLAEVEVGDFPRRAVDAVGPEDLVFTVRRDLLVGYESAEVHHLEWAPYPVSAGQELGYMVVAEGTPHETRVALVSAQHRGKPNILVRVLAFLGAVFSLWWKALRWLIPGL